MFETLFFGKTGVFTALKPPPPHTHRVTFNNGVNRSSGDSDGWGWDLHSPVEWPLYQWEAGPVTFGPITAFPGQMWPEGEHRHNLSIWEWMDRKKMEVERQKGTEREKDCHRFHPDQWESELFIGHVAQVSLKVLVVLCGLDVAEESLLTRRVIIVFTAWINI